MVTTYIFLFLFSFSGNSTTHTVVPQPSMEVCENNGHVMVNANRGGMISFDGPPYNYYMCIDMSKPLPYNFKWDYKS